MKTALIKNISDIIISDTEPLHVSANGIRIKVTASGICGTDVANAHQGLSAYQPFGHEVAGTVLETGTSVTRVKAGDNVVLESASACGMCDNCRNGRQELCTDIQSFFNKPTSFGMAEEMNAPAISAIRTSLSPDIATLSEPLAVAVDMVRLADIRCDSNVLIMGPGPIGLMALALVKRMGARKVFISGRSTNKARLAVAERFGVDAIVAPDKVTSYPYGCAIDRILVTAPPPVLNDAFAVAAKGAVVSYIGIGHGDDAFCRFDANVFHFKKLQLKASFASPALYTPLALQYLSEGVVDGAALISHRFPLKDIAQAMKTAADTAASVKVVIVQE
ncbi:MAG: alcohol dehydrogenase catalytic domain-containing protein [Spirochaetes bacterium]|nr:alcohol dehydrogenase catalytic domain-containing protein [Spirochaetota bacterium]